MLFLQGMGRSKDLDDMGAGKRLELDPLTAGEDGRKKLMGAGSDQEQVGFVGRLFQGLENGVGGRLIQTVCRVNNAGPTSSFQRPESKSLLHVPDLIDLKDVSLGFQKDHVGMVGRIDLRTGGTPIAGISRSGG